MLTVIFNNFIILASPLLAADKLFCLSPMSPEEPRKSSVLNMVCLWPLLANKYSQFHHVAREYVFVHSAIGRQKEINEQQNFFPHNDISYLNSVDHFPSFLHVLLARGWAT